MEITPQSPLNEVSRTRRANACRGRCAGVVWGSTLDAQRSGLTTAEIGGAIGRMAEPRMRRLDVNKVSNLMSNAKPDIPRAAQYRDSEFKNLVDPRVSEFTT